MLRLLPDFINRLFATRLTIGLASDGIAIVQSKGFKKAITKNNIVHQQFIASEKADWQSIVKQLDAALSQLKLSRNTVCTVVLSSDFVRYLVLPPQPFAMNKAEKSAYLQAAYRDIYGDIADGWQIKRDDTAPQEPMLAAAVDATLIAALQQLATQHVFRLQSIQPYLMAAFNGLMPQIWHKNGYLALLESSKLLLIRLQNGQCQHLRTLNISTDWPLDLQQAVERESALSDDAVLNQKSLLIYAPAQNKRVLNEISGWKTNRLGLKAGLLNTHCAMLEAVLCLG